MGLLLRLDNGSLIGRLEPDGSVKRVSIDEAFGQGRLGLADRQRLSRLLEIAKQRSGNIAGNATAEKRKDFESPEVQGDAKRAKGRPGAARRDSINSNQSWQEKCRVILQKVFKSLGAEQQWFDRPVDEYYIPGYYSKIKNPMDLGTMRNKLDLGKYKGPSGFCEDMRQVWENCLIFNGKQSKYGHIGDRTSILFEELWAASGIDAGSSRNSYSTPRHRRSNAGVAAAKYELEEEEVLPRQRSVRKQTSVRAATSSRSAKQQEEAATIPMERDQMRVLAEWMGSLEGDELEGAISIIREHGHGKTGSEEIELDFDALDNETLWALDDFMMNQSSKNPNSGGMANSGFHVEPESDYESDESEVMDD